MRSDVKIASMSREERQSLTSLMERYGWRRRPDEGVTLLDPVGTYFAFPLLDTAIVQLVIKKPTLDLTPAYYARWIGNGYQLVSVEGLPLAVTDETLPSEIEEYWRTWMLSLVLARKTS